MKRNSLALARRYAFSEPVSDEMLLEMGRGLWAALGLQAEFEAARREALPEILPVVIESDRPEIQSLPWETLYHPEHGFLGKEPAFTLSRRITNKKPKKPRLEEGPLRVLLFTSLPADLNPETQRLNVEEEQAQVQEALAPWEKDGTVVLRMPDDGQFETLKHLLKEFQPHLVFLSGHGKFHDEAHSQEPPYGVFIFEDEAGNSDPVHDQDLAKAFIGSRAQAVIISACESGKAASTDLNNGIAEALSDIGIPHVIGMRESILDIAGIKFARELCDQLIHQERMDTALQTARQAISAPLSGINRRETTNAVRETLSPGQWCLPCLLSSAPEQPLIDWDFPRQPRQVIYTFRSQGTVSLPPRFIGRRVEQRQNTRLLRQRGQLLITGPGGQGKTALAGKLAQDLEQAGYLVLAWAARPENPWEIFVTQVKLKLPKELAEVYERTVQEQDDGTKRASLLLSLLMDRYQNRVVLFLDNLESIQDGETHQLNDPAVNAWIQAARGLTARGLRLLLTSRFSLPGWPVSDQRQLNRLNYGDFLTLAQQVNLPAHFYHQRGRLRLVYAALHGNGRGLEIFAGAAAVLTADEEDIFLEKLADARAETQVYMSLEVIYSRLKPAAGELLSRLRVYHSPVPVEGVLKIALDLADPGQALAELLGVSLVERQYNSEYQADEFQLSALVVDLLEKKRLPPPPQAMYALAAQYQLYLFEHERNTFTQALAVHRALLTAGEQNAADRFALTHIIGRLSLAGFYHDLLEEWLPAMCESQDIKIRGAALGQTGKQLLHTGDYDTALSYLQQSLQIQQQIGDKAGEGTTLNNISQIYKARGDYDTALSYLQQSLQIQQQIGDRSGMCATLFNIGHIHANKEEWQAAISAWLVVYQIARQLGQAQALQALANLAPQLGLPPELQGWEELLQRGQAQANSD